MQRPGIAKDAEVVSVDGQGWVQFAATPDWRGAERAQELTAGDGLRTGDFGRMGVLFADGVQIKLSRRTTIVVKSVARPGSADTTAVGVERGEIWSRAKVSPGAVRVDTPSATAAIRGTDWDIVVDEKGTSYLTVLRGAVEFFNPAGSLLVEQGQQAMAEIGRAPVRTFLVQPAERVQWVFSFPLDVPAAVPFRFHNRQPAAAALDGARERLSRSSSDPEAMLQLAGLLYDLKSDTESAELFDRVLAANPAEPHALTWRGLLALRAREPAKADALFDRAIAARGSDPVIEARIGKVGALAHLGRLGEAASIVDDLLSQPDAPAVVGVASANFQAYAGEFLRAAETAVRFAHRFPDDERFPTLLAAIWTILDDNSGAELAVTQALRLNPDSSAALAISGEIHHLEGRGDEAEAAYRRALELDPTNVVAHNGLALILAERGFFRESVTSLGEALTQTPDTSILWANRGYVHTLIEELAAARGDFREALARDPGQHLALTGEALVAIKQGRPGEATDDALRAGLLEPRLSRPHDLAAIAYYQQGMIDRALQELELAAQLDPKDPFPHLIAYVIYQDTYRPYDAVQSAQKVLERLPYLKSIDALENTQQGLSSLGSALLGFGLPEWAESYAQESFNPHHAGSHFQASRRYNLNRTASVSELVQGLLLDPLAHSQATRFQDIIRRPRTSLTLGGSWGDEAGGFSQNYNAVWQGYRRLPWEVAWSIQTQGYDRAGSGINDDSHGASVALGIGVRPNIDHGFSFAVDWYRDRSGTPGSPLAPDPDDKLEMSDFTIDVGYHWRIGPKNDVLVRASFGKSANDFTNAAPFGTDLTDLQASFIFAGWTIDETRGFFEQGVFDLTPLFGAPGISVATDSTNTLAGVSGVVRLPSAFPAFVDTDRRSREETTNRTWLVQLRHLLALGREHEFTYGAEFVPVRSRTTTRATAFSNVDAVFFYEEPILNPNDTAWTFPLVARSTDAAAAEEDSSFLTLYVDDRWQPHRRLLIEGGLFFESFDGEYSDDNHLFPRLAAAVEIAPGHVLRVGAQRWLDKSTRGTLAPIAAAGLLVDNGRAVDASTLRDYQLRLESRWTPRLFTAIGAERIVLTDAPHPNFFARDHRLERVSIAANAILTPQLAGFARYAHTDAEEKGGPFAGLDVPDVPREFAGVGLMWVSPRQFRVAVAQNYVGEQAIDYTSNARVSGFWSTNISATWEPRNKRVLVSLAVSNLLDNDSPAPGRSVFLTVEGRF